MFNPNETQSEKEKEQIGNVQVGKEDVVIGDFSGLETAQLVIQYPCQTL